MHFGFLSPGLLIFAVLAAAAPLAAHLIARTRPPEKRFPAVEFLRRANRRVWRPRRPRDILTLVLRTLALGSLALAFLRPLWFSGTDFAGVGETKHLIMLMDRSGSMSAMEDGQSRFSLAKARAVEALRGAGKLNSVNLVWIDSVPDAVFPDMGRSAPALEAAIDEASVSGENGDAVAALRLAVDRLTPLVGALELIVVSDFQADSWSGPLPELPGTIHLILVPVGDPADNLSLSDLELEPAALLAGEPVRVAGKVENHSDERRTVRVAVTVGDQRVTREIAIEPRAESAFFAEAPAPEDRSEFPVKASIEDAGDALPVDDDRWIVGRVREPLRVGLLFEEDAVTEAEEAMWRRLLRSLDWAREVDDPGRAELLVAAGNAESLAKTLGALLAAGGAVFYRPGPAGDGAVGRSLFPSLATEQGRWETRAPGESGWRLRIPGSAENEPLFRLFAGGEYGNPASGGLRQRWRVSAAPGKLSPGAALLLYEDGVPAIWKSSADSGTAWWWNLPLDPAQSTWVLQPAFLPLVGEALLESRPASAPATHLEVAPGRHAVWEPAVFPEGGETVLLERGGGEIPLSEDTASPGVLAYRSTAPLQPGAYRWTRRDAALGREIVLAHTAVNFPRSEMDLRPADGASLEVWANTRPKRGGGVIDWSRLRDGVPLWPWLAGFALCLFGVEAAILLHAARAPSAPVVR